MRILILGAPGAGKGTQAKLIAEKYGVSHISTGDIFRANIKGKTPLGNKALGYISKGLLVPDDVTIELVTDYLDNNNFINGYILDGFPRTIPQAEALNDYMLEKGIKIDYVINVDVPDELILDRMSGRRTCLKCGATYHVSNNPPKVEDICDSCGSTLIQRDDDKPGTVAKRLEVYHKETKPLIEYYKDKTKYIVVDGTKHVEEVFVSLVDMLGE